MRYIKNNYFLIYFFLLAFCVGASSSAPGTEDLIERGSIEEGWRYHAPFEISLTDQESHPPLKLDLSLEHQAMAKLIKEVPHATWSKRGSERGSDSCVLRFTPILMGEGNIFLGHSIKLMKIGNLPLEGQENLDLPFYELIFRSGSGPDSNTVIQSGFTGEQISTTKINESELNEFVTFSSVKYPLLSFEKGTKPDLRNLHLNVMLQRLPLNIIFQKQISSIFLEERILFRYPQDPTETCFASSNYDPIRRLHREHLLSRRKNTEELLELCTQAGKFFRDATRTKLDALKIALEGKRDFKCSGANNYACAEQAALNYLLDERIKDYLRRALNLEEPRMIGPETKGIIINIHCNETPCSSCATALAREIEAGGIFREIFPGTPLFLLGSCQDHYERTKSTTKFGLHYFNTKYLEGAILSGDRQRLEGRMTQPLERNLQNPIALPYPIVLLKENPDTQGFEIDSRRLIEFIQAQQDIGASSVTGNLHGTGAGPSGTTEAAGGEGASSSGTP